MRYKYTDKEYRILKRNAVIVVDTAEQENSHIIKGFEEKKIKYSIEKIHLGDYTIKIAANEETKPLGIEKDLYFDRKFVIERKNSLGELAGNFTTDRPRITKEFAQMKAYGIKCYLYLEDANFLENLRTENYHSKMKNTSLNKSLRRFISRFDLNFRAIKKEEMWTEINQTLLAELEEYLEKKGIIEVDEKEG